MGGHGPYVWTAYGITLAILIWNVWSALSLLRRNLRRVAGETAAEEPARRPKVSRMEDD